MRYPARNKPSKSQSSAETFCQRHTIGPESYGNPVFVLTGRESVVISHACQCILNLELWPCQKKILHNCMRRQRCLLRAVSPNGIVGCLLEKTMPFALRFMVFLRCSFRFAPEFSPSGAVFSRDDILPKSLFGEHGVQLSPLEPHGTCRPWRHGLSI